MVDYTISTQKPNQNSWIIDL